ncbi:hypothetical protein KH5H1_58380 [Corallococcus caeni]|nr:hypothetical protein KH5H1_58380 [Corallococcus sp. KH5-1]
MNGVAPSRAASAFTASDTPVDSDTGSDAPRNDCAEGRGRSVGNSSAVGAPWSCARHQSNSAWSTSPWSQERCHTAKSAYWRGRGASAGACPAAKARYSEPSSRAKTPMDQPSETMWCSVRSSQ